MSNPDSLIDRLYKRAEEGYYDDKPAYQFSVDELNLFYYFGWIDEARYQLKKQELEQRINEYYCHKHHYLLVL